MAERVERKIRRMGAPRHLLARAGAAVAIVGVAIAVAWTVVWRNDSSSQPTGPLVAKPIKSVALSASGLRTLAHLVPQPIFWAGPKKHYLYELTRKTNGNVYIRYLPPGVNAGAPAGKYLVVATYPFTGAFHALQAVAKGKAISVPGHGIAVVDENDPTSVHLAYPGVNYQVEVSDPSPAVARSIALSAVRPAR